MDVKKMLKSFTYAGEGFGSLLRSENNFQFHFLAATLVVIAGFLLNISGFEWCFIILSIALVFMAEAFNTALEKLADHVSPDIHPQIKTVKDISAAAVLVVAVAAVVMAAIIFIPKIASLF